MKWHIKYEVQDVNTGRTRMFKTYTLAKKWVETVTQDYLKEPKTPLSEIIEIRIIRIK